MYKGLEIRRHVPLDVLPSDIPVYVAETHYRVVFDAALPADVGPIVEGMKAAARRMSAICSMHVIFPFHTVANPTADLCQGVPNMHRDDSVIPIDNAEHMDCNSLELVVRHGVQRNGKFPVIGAEEFAHSRMLDEMFKDHTGLQPRFLLRNITAVPEGIHVLSYLPFTPLYADKTVLQLRGRGVSPFGRRLQDSLLIAFDYLALNLAAKLSHIDIARITTSSYFLESAGMMGEVNITLVSVGENPHQVFGQVLQAKLEDLTDRMSNLGIILTSAVVLSSHPTPAALQDQVAGLLPQGDSRRGYDQRVKRRVTGIGPLHVDTTATCTESEGRNWIIIITCICLCLAGAAWFSSSSYHPQSIVKLASWACTHFILTLCIRPVTQMHVMASPGQQSAAETKPSSSLQPRMSKHASASPPQQQKSSSAMLSTPFAPGIARVNSLGVGAASASLSSGTASEQQPQALARSSNQLRRVPASAFAPSTWRPSLEAQALETWPSTNSRCSIFSSSQGSGSGFQDLKRLSSDFSASKGQQHRQHSADGAIQQAASNSRAVLQHSLSGDHQDQGVEPADEGADPLKGDDLLQERLHSGSSAGPGPSGRASAGRRNSGDGPDQQSLDEAPLSCPLSTRASSLTGWEIDPDDIIIVTRPDGSDHLLGSGSYGQVFKALLRGVTQPIALKLISWEASETSADVRRRALRELSHLQDCWHQHIVRCYGACLWQGQLAMATELMPRGTLHTALASRALKWGPRALQVALDVCRGLTYLHARKIAHLDLKSPNILLAHDFTAKLADVGIARALSHSFVSTVTSVGTWSWSAPELLLGSKVTVKADIYSFGVVLWELATGEQPRRGQLKHLKGSSGVPQAVDRMIDACTHHDVSKRPSAEQLVDQLQELMDSMQSAHVANAQPAEPPTEAVETAARSTDSPRSLSSLSASAEEYDVTAMLNTDLVVDGIASPFAASRK